MIHKQMCSDFFGNGYGAVGQVATGATIAAGASGTITIATRRRPIYRNQMINIWNNNSGVPGTTQRGTRWYVLSRTNYGTTITVTLFNASGSSATIATDDHLTAMDSWDGTFAVSMLGLNYFSDATIALHGLSKTTYPELVSYTDSNSGTLREPTNLLFGKAFSDIYDAGWKPPERGIWPRDVRDLYHHNQGLRVVYNTGIDRQVMNLADGGGRGDTQYTTENGTIEFMVSAYCPKNTIYMIRPDAFVRYAPYGINSLQFVGESMMLGGGMWLPSIGSGGNYTTLREAPFRFCVEMGCLAPQTIAKISDVKGLTDVL